MTEVKIARPREGLGGRSPPRNKNIIFILALCAPRMVPDVNIRGNPVSPPAVSLSNRTPACGGSSRSHQRVGTGETRFPHPPACGGCQPLPPAVGNWGNPVSPSPCLWGGASRSHQRLGTGETRFPHPPACRGCQPLPTAVGTWGNRVSPTPSLRGELRTEWCQSSTTERAYV